ncbi:MAG: DUF2726 domain-containing protein [Pseudomonadota bacterium]
MDQMIPIIAALILLSVAGLAWKIFRRRLEAKASTAPKGAPEDRTDTSNVRVDYTSRETLMTPAEAQAFRLLYRRLKGIGYLCPKVRIADLISVQTPDAPKQRLRELSKLSQKHVDFAVISIRGDILCAVEIDDPSHRTPKTIKRDQFVNAVFEAADIALFRGDLAELDAHEGLDEFIKNQLAKRAAKKTA